PASACLMNPMICSVVKRLFFMSVLVVDGLYSFTRYGSAGAGHDQETDHQPVFDFIQPFR
ncbi:hypothetical protein, partial [Xanthomonas campestris]|uniref:hypothetical protein n=1 Tax=Xanthomonas campestris TaxID=339 RepID=UPI0039C187B6